ncbi:hypothetical protein [Halochromatium roseum]|uniref:hypothetical protein n=1 Tax=Halochromatium roseum TaxID=391920 RepID=UPI001911D322|nr:hypothetical protein [Halochromatium roseum]MBK5938324.1 hypothetical protein [Halochromatium roseum]
MLTDRRFDRWLFAVLWLLLLTYALLFAPPVPADLLGQLRDLVRLAERAQLVADADLASVRARGTDRVAGVIEDAGHQRRNQLFRWGVAMPLC